MAGFIQVSPTQLTSLGDVTAKLPVGTYGEFDGKIYRYVKFDNGTAVAAAAGSLCYWKNEATFVVTSDYSDAGTLLNNVCGVFMSILVDDTYGWIQVNGRRLYVLVASSPDEGEALIASSTDGVAVEIALGTAPTNKVVGYALADDIGTTGVETYLTMF